MSIETKKPFQVGDRVWIHNGFAKGKAGTISKQDPTAGFFFVLFDDGTTACPDADHMRHYTSPPRPYMTYRVVTTCSAQGVRSALVAIDANATPPYPAVAAGHGDTPREALEALTEAIAKIHAAQLLLIKECSR